MSIFPVPEGPKKKGEVCYKCGDVIEGTVKVMSDLYLYVIVDDKDNINGIAVGRDSSDNLQFECIACRFKDIERTRQNEDS